MSQSRKNDFPKESFLNTEKTKYVGFKDAKPMFKANSNRSFPEENNKSTLPCPMETSTPVSSHQNTCSPLHNPYQRCKITATEWAPISTHRVVWNIKNYSKRGVLDLANAQSYCTLKTGTDNIPSCTLQFFIAGKSIRQHGSSVNSKQYSLCVVLFDSTYTNENISFSTDVHELNSLLDIKQTKVTGEVVTLKGRFQHQVVCQEFLCVNGNSAPTMEVEGHAYGVSVPEDDLILGVSVTMYADKNKPEEHKKQDRGVDLLSANFGKMFDSKEMWPDVELISQDLLSVPAHKFVLAARSSVFQDLIIKEVAKETFDGKIRIVDVCGKPLSAVLHWMYTGQVPIDSKDYMAQVAAAAAKYKLHDLLRQLDDKLIKICSEENMFYLFQLAKQWSMPKAMGDIREYIKQNIGNVSCNIGDVQFSPY